MTNQEWARHVLAQPSQHTPEITETARRILGHTTEAASAPAVEPKASFEEWRLAVANVIRDIARIAYMENSPAMVAMYYSNHDPVTAARVWLRDMLENAP